LHELGVKVLDWPAKSPDLNPIESLLSIIDDKLKFQPISSLKELTEALATAWLSIKTELCKKKTCIFNATAISEIYCS